MICKKKLKEEVKKSSEAINDLSLRIKSEEPYILYDDVFKILIANQIVILEKLKDL